MPLTDRAIRHRLQQVESVLRPRFKREPEFLNLAGQFMDIEGDFGDEALAPYSYEVFPELPQDEAGRKIFHVCTRQLQLMENVFIDLHLDDLSNRRHHLNRGWMNLFRRWAQSRRFREAWCITAGIYSDGFQQFCEEALGLRYAVFWRPAAPADLTPAEREYVEWARGKRGFGSDRITVNGRELEAGRIWMADLGLDEPAPAAGAQPALRFPVGLALARLAAPAGRPVRCDLVFYAVREPFRQMRLLERMAPSFKRAAGAHLGVPVTFGVIFPDQGSREHYGYFFKRFGYEVLNEDTPETPAPPPPTAD